MAKDKKRDFKIADPLTQLNAILENQSKYKLGEKGYTFYDIKHLKPVFAFDYLSLTGSDLCFNSERLDIKDYVGLFEGLKKLSLISYNELKVVPAYRFHSVNFDEHKISISKKDFKRILTHKEELLSDEELPTLYQFDFQYHQKARACGFLYRGVFYLVWYDRHHKIYPGE